MKKYIILLLLGITFLNAENLKLNAVFELNRFFDNDKISYELNYKINNTDLTFTKTEKSISTKINVEYKIFDKDKNIYHDKYTRTLALRHELEASSQTKFFADKIAIDKINFSAKNYKIWVKVTNAKKQTEHTQKLVPLSVDASFSDIEINYAFYQNPNSIYPMFLRNSTVCINNTSHIFAESVHDSLGIYYQFKNKKLNSGTFLTQNIVVTKKDGDFKQKYKSSFYYSNPYAENFTSIDISKLQPGFYNISINVTDDDFSQKANSYFIIKGSKIKGKRFFTDIDDEFKLICYFTSCDRKTWKKLSYDGKSLYLQRFWGSTSNSESNAAFSKISERIELANKKFSAVKYKGWETNQGRIFIKRGQPEEVVKGKADARNYTIKEYEIWKYKLNGDYTYVFLDNYGNGNFQLIYAENDETERSRHNWKELLGPNFDEEELK